MTTKKKTQAQEEEETVERSLMSHIPEGEMVSSINYFERLDDVTYPVNTYDVVIYRLEERPRYYIGTAASRARDGLKPGGLFLVDYFGFAGNLDEIRVIVEFEGLQYKEHDKRNSVVVFTKSLVNEWPAVGVSEEI